MGLFRKRVSEAQIKERIGNIGMQNTMELKGYINSLLDDIKPLGNEKVVFYKGEITVVLRKSGLRVDEYIRD